MIEMLGKSAQKNCHYRLFKNVDETKIKQANLEQYKISQFKRPAISIYDEIEQKLPNPIFDIQEFRNNLSLVPRRPVPIRNCVVGIEQIIHPPAIDITPESGFSLEYIKQLS